MFNRTINSKYVMEYIIPDNKINIYSLKITSFMINKGIIESSAEKLHKTNFLMGKL